MCVGAEAKDCHLSDYTYTYVRTGDSLILEHTSIKSHCIINITMVDRVVDQSLAIS